MENFRTGVLDRLGFSVERLHELNPRLVVLSITGFGHDGPEGGRAGYDQIAQGEAGLMSLTGPSAGRADRVGVPIGDLLAGMYGAYGVARRAARAGDAPVADASCGPRCSPSVVGVHAYQGTRWTVAHEVPHALGNHHPSIAPYGLFRAADAPVQIACGTEQQWTAVAALLGIEDDRFATNRSRVGHRAELVAVIETALASRPAEAWLEQLAALGVPAGKVRTLDDVYAWDQTRSQGLLIDVQHPTLGTVQLPGPPLRFDDNAYAGARETHLPPPRLGEHDDAVRAWLDSLD